MTNQQEREAFEAWLQSQGLYGPSGKFGVAAFEGWQARAALAAKAVPAGWKLVPVEPSDDMQAAGWNTGSAGDGYWDCGNPVDTYRAMLAASPPAPAPKAKSSPEYYMRHSVLGDGTRAVKMWPSDCEEPPLVTVTGFVPEAEPAPEAKPTWDNGEAPLVGGGLIRPGLVDYQERAAQAQQADTKAEAKPLPSVEEIEGAIGFRLPAYSLNLLFNLLRRYGIGANTGGKA